MEKKYIYPKNYFSNKPLSLEDSKWKLYKGSYSKINKGIINNNINNKISNYNIYKTKALTNSQLKPVLNNDIDHKVENIKLSLYSKINKNSSQLLLYLEEIKYLTQENLSLKQRLQNKDKIITDFEILFKQLKEKFIKLDNLNQYLRNKILNKKENGNYKEVNIDYNKKDLLDSFNNIKDDINKIKNNYCKKLKEKDELLEKMNKELLYIHNEYKKLSDMLEKVNNTFIINSNYNELKNKINDLLKQKEFLMKQNEQREKRIIDLQKRNEQTLSNENLNIIENEDLIITFKNQENEYVKTINMLQNRIIEKDREIQMIKEEYDKIINNKDRLK